jgi:cobalamin biosynthesis protein CbiG
VTVVVGIGASSRATAEEINALVHEALAGAGLPAADVSGVATIAARAGDPRLAALGWPITGFDAAELAVVPVATEGARVFEAVGTASVAEAAALLAAGTGSHLIAPKRRSAHATIALAQKAPAP